MTEPINELLEWLHTFDDTQFSCNHRNVIEKIWQIKSKQQLLIHSVVNCVYVVTERDNYGEQTFRQVFAKREQAVEYLKEQGLIETNIDEINEIELD